MSEKLKIFREQWVFMGFLPNSVIVHDNVITGERGGLCYFEYLFLNVFLDSLQLLSPDLFVF